MDPNTHMTSQSTEEYKYRGAAFSTIPLSQQIPYRLPTNHVTVSLGVDDSTLQTSNGTNANEEVHEQHQTSFKFILSFFKSNWIFLSLCALLFSGIAVMMIFIAEDTTTISRPVSNVTRFPAKLYQGASLHQFGIPSSMSKWPTTTREAILSGWDRETSSPCVRELGESWIYKNKRSAEQSVTLYFSPHISDHKPGILTGIAVHYYGNVPTGLIGTYFTHHELDADGNAFHSVEVTFQDSSKYNLCDEDLPLPEAKESYIKIAPRPLMANLEVPTIESSPELQMEWQEGSCIEGMGYHYLRNAIGGSKKLSYKSNSIVPVVPMYHPSEDKKGEIAGLFFWAPEQLQEWPHECNGFSGMSLEDLHHCKERSNFWDPSPGLLQENELPFFMCSNTCDENCYFEDSFDGLFTTMHLFFDRPEELKCPTEIYCRNGLDWISKLNPSSVQPISVARSVVEAP